MQEKTKRIHVKRLRRAVLLLAVAFLFCGCTKRDELLLISGDSDPMQTAVIPEAADQTAQSGTEEISPGTAPDLATAGTFAASENAEKGQADPAVSGTAGAADIPTEPSVIYVHVCGAVLQPGVYELAAGSRVYEAVQAAGGFTEEAEENYVNQAQALDDGVKLVIPTVEEAALARGSASLPDTSQTADTGQDSTGQGAEHLSAQIGIVAGTPLSGNAQASETGQTADAGGTDAGCRININTASEAKLCEIPGVGATRAAAITAYREAHGSFQKPEDIMKVNGIKEGMYQKIKDSICVN